MAQRKSTKSSPSKGRGAAAVAGASATAGVAGAGYAAKSGMKARKATKKVKKMGTGRVKDDGVKGVVQMKPTKKANTVKASTKVTTKRPIKKTVKVANKSLARAGGGAAMVRTKKGNYVAKGNIKKVKSTKITSLKLSPAPKGKKGTKIKLKATYTPKKGRTVARKQVKALNKQGRIAAKYVRRTKIGAGVAAAGGAVAAGSALRARRKSK